MVEMGTPLGENGEFFFSGSWLEATGAMKRWALAHAVAEELLAEANINTDWSIVHELSDVDVRRWELGLGARFRFKNGFGFQLSGKMTDYKDQDPILEDETGRYFNLLSLLSYSF